MVLPNSLSSYYEKFLATGEVKCIDDEIPFEIPKGWVISLRSCIAISPSTSLMIIPQLLC